jgi:hypothetical protein
MDPCPISVAGDMMVGGNAHPGAECLAGPVRRERGGGSRPVDSKRDSEAETRRAEHDMPAGQKL